MKSLPFTQEELRSIVSEYPTPFYIYDEKAIRENAKRLHRSFSWNRGYREYFAVKSTPNPYILQIFKEEGCGVDCASAAELLLAHSCGFFGEDIMFTSNATPAHEYQQAKKLGAIINLDDIGHVDFLNNCAGIPELICCRYNPGTEIRYKDKVILNFKDSKFGSTKEQLTDGFRHLLQLGVKRFGIHAQFGAHRREANYFGMNARILFQLAVDLFRATGIKVEFINLAGGLGIPFRPEDSAADIEAVSQSIKQAYDEVIVSAGLDPLPLFSELGIYMTGPYGYFVSSVLHVKKTYKEFIGLDASTNSFMSPAKYTDYHHISVIGKENGPHDHVYDITGALCETRDRFATDRSLPRIIPGDLLLFHDAGAYAYSHSYTFNGKLRPAELLLTMDGSVRIIRRAETPADYFATLDFPGSKFAF